MTTNVDQIIADAVTFSARLGLIQPDSIARTIRTALAEADYRIEPDNGWEWGLYSSEHEAIVTEDDDHNIFTEETARVSASPRWVLVCRHPATEWESVE